jgi:GDP-mannose 6-dehydrogenase
VKYNKEKLAVAVFGLGYVGCVTAACLAHAGHDVTGLDVSELKTRAIEAGSSPINEPGLDDLIRQYVKAGSLKTSTDITKTIQQSDASIICVGTPSTSQDGINLEYVKRVCEQIGEALADREPGHVVILRSTVLPGTMKNIVRPTLELKSGKKEGEHFFIAFNPEFMREGSAIKDYRNPGKIVAGASSPQAEATLRTLYARVEAPFILTSPEVGEMLKYVNNIWHALKITFANEIGEICKKVSVDSHTVMDIFMQDKHLNISTAYLKPGFAFGGSCLPKDLKALMHFARHNDVEVPVLSKIMTSNISLIERTFHRILQTGAKKIGMYGLSFKPQTDDLRESPYVILAEWLIGKGLKVKIFDEYIQVPKLTGANKEYINNHLPHLVDLLVDDFPAFDKFAELVVIGHRSEGASDWVRKRDTQIRVLDLARLDRVNGVANYEGISW